MNPQSSSRKPIKGASTRSNLPSTSHTMVGVQKLTRNGVSLSLHRPNKLNAREAVFICTQNPPFRDPPEFPALHQRLLKRRDLALIW